MTALSDSGSSCSPSDVEPVTSVNRIVTVLRVSRVVWPAPSSVPQKPQRRNCSGLSSPHDGQRITRRVYDSQSSVSDAAMASVTPARPTGVTFSRPGDRSLLFLCRSWAKGREVYVHDPGDDCPAPD